MPSRGSVVQQPATTLGVLVFLSRRCRALLKRVYIYIYMLTLASRSPVNSILGSGVFCPLPAFLCPVGSVTLTGGERSLLEGRPDFSLGDPRWVHTNAWLWDATDMTVLCKRLELVL